MSLRDEGTFRYRVRAKLILRVKTTATQALRLPSLHFPALRQVFTAEHPIHVVGGELAAGEASLPSMTEQQGVRPRDNNFRVSVSRAFGSIYVWARPLDVQREIRRTAVMARLQEEDLIPLVSPNWMET